MKTFEINDSRKPDVILIEVEDDGIEEVKNALDADGFQTTFEGCVGKQVKILNCFAIDSAKKVLTDLGYTEEEVLD